MLNRALESDIVLYTMESITPFSFFDRDLLDDYIKPLHINISAIIANKFDLCKHHDRQELYIKVQASEYVDKNAVFCVSSKEALDAYKENNDELLQKSGIPKVKEFIERLAVGKERERFIASSNALKDVICKKMMPAINSEITKTFGEHKSEKMGNLIFISTELKSVVAGLDKLIDEIESQTSNETK